MNRLCILGALLAFALSPGLADDSLRLTWDEQPPIPDELGFAGPFVGVHESPGRENGARGQVLLVAGGANFPKPIWSSQKVWHDNVFVATSVDGKLRWREVGNLPRPIGYGAAISTPDGVLCIGGNDATRTFDDCFLLRWNNQTDQLETIDYPRLPRPCAFGSATIIDDTVYVSGGQSDSGLDSAMNQLWALDLSQRNDQESFRWKILKDCPGPTRALNLTVAQHNGKETCVYVISGRRQAGDKFELLSDVWEYNPTGQAWRQRADAPHCVMAGAGIAIGRSHILVAGGDNGELFGRADELKDQHPGFFRRALAYDTRNDRWVSAGPSPMNQVTTIAVHFGGAILIPSGEIRPRVRTPKVHRIRLDALAED